MSKALLLIDVQNHWSSVNPKTTQAIREALPWMRRLMPVIWVFNDSFKAHKHPYEIPCKNLSHKFEEAMHPAIAPDAADVAFMKTGRDVFASTPYITNYLCRRGITEPTFGGFMANRCVAHSAEGAAMNGFKPSIWLSLTADYEDQLNMSPIECDDVSFLDVGDLERLKNQALTLQP